MSYQSFIGGKLVESTGGNDLSFAKEEIVLNSIETITVTGVDTGVTFNTPLNPPPTNEIGDCIVEFRPRTPNYGKFGFDWVRIGDNNTGGIHDTTYLGNMGKHADNSYLSTFTAEPSPYTKFKGLITNEFNPLPITIPELKKTDIRDQYATPWLSLYRVPEGRLLPDGTADPEAGTCIAATLKLLIEVKTEPTELRLEFDDRYFTITGGTITKAEATKPNMSYFAIASKAPTAGTPHTQDIEINCIKETPETKSIKAFAITKDATTGAIIAEKCAGKLLIKANNKANRKQKKIVLVNVYTSLASGDFAPGQEDVLKHALRQALINPITEKINLRLATDTSFNAYVKTTPAVPATATTPAVLTINQIIGYYLYDYVNSHDNTNKPAGWKDLYKYLQEKLVAQEGAKYNSYIKVFYFGSIGGNIKVDGTFSPLNGYSQPGQKTTLLFHGYDAKATTPHEVLHSMGLDHTFESKDVTPAGQTTTNAPNGKYTFKAKTTDNIMDYSHSARPAIDRISLMEWQWEVVRATSQPEP
jgi:hypothetical protein